MVGCIVHTRTGHISTSGLKSDTDITFVFLDPNFRDLRTFKADI